MSTKSNSDPNGINTFLLINSNNKISGIHCSPHLWLHKDTNKISKINYTKYFLYLQESLSDILLQKCDSASLGKTALLTFMIPKI